MLGKLKSVSVAGGIICLLVFSPVLISGTSTGYSRNETSSGSFTLYNSYNSIESKYSRELLIEEARFIYDTMQLKRYGLTKKAFEYAWSGYKILLQKGRLKNPEIISICDFSQSSRKKRLYIINVEEMKVLVNTYVAHGRNSGSEYARSFSNNPESHKSSLGFYVTRETYHGVHGLALKLAGLERGINDKADKRNIVIHGSDYVGDNFLLNNKFTGRSYGCPAIPLKLTAKVINTIKNGSCLFIYHPSKNYLIKSKILNS